MKFKAVFLHSKNIFKGGYMRRDSKPDRMEEGKERMKKLSSKVVAYYMHLMEKFYPNIALI